MNIEPVQWQAPPEELSFSTLKPKDVHIWLIHSSTQNFLDRDEQKRADKLLSPIHQKRFRDAHNGLREILGKYLHQSPKEIVFDTTTSGKPILKNHPELQFNLSHSEELALCAISKNPVGIDIEYLNKEINCLDVAKRFFSDAEYNFLKSMVNPEKLRLEFFKLWTEKEAYLKSQGRGISTGLEMEISKKIGIQHFVPAPHYLAAVGGGERFICYRQQ
jgi:4'-phosphopantetheinyl transferase